MVGEREIAQETTADTRAKQKRTKNKLTTIELSNFDEKVNNCQCLTFIYNTVHIYVCCDANARKKRRKKHAAKGKKVADTPKYTSKM